MKWRLTLLIIIMLTVTTPAIAEGKSLSTYTMGQHITDNPLGMTDPHLEPYLPYGIRQPLLTLYLTTDCEEGFEDTVSFLVLTTNLNTHVRYVSQFRQWSQMAIEDKALFGPGKIRVRIWPMRYVPEHARVELYSVWGGSEPFYWCEW